MPKGFTVKAKTTPEKEEVPLFNKERCLERIRGKSMDVGVDGNGLFPISMSEVLNLLDKQPIDGFLDKDHHTIVENYK